MLRNAFTVNNSHKCRIQTDKPRQYIILEKTPKWLEERTYEKQTQNEYDPQLEKEREAFLKQLQVDWEE